ncbi:16S rRNA (cytosine(1402)-N(4))-methyltransferase [candidate division KSB3 bacterium]|uniref:Ribosomal RNA small subunit methyltransferase H n=1 Tax=candidate division KSB3 bacterium TaxID=2044937 RepID=A0A2G6E564_9BACT|nr:MAG: 16S rRNA (cytosine(1402)-N(4))-methyltransferase [candidate division KSB3 bacterium]PIE29786.1 MAG: 16S rRNA (cytosine(1402)-N(4))-methyltransferase [candidate division KSB3 bacterium]
MDEQEELENVHIPVLLNEVLEGLRCRQAGIFLDGTLGCGGHTKAILETHSKNRVIGIDRDQDALQTAGERLQYFGERVKLFHGRHEAFEEFVMRFFQTVTPGEIDSCLDGFLLDLGLSSLQLDRAERGFALQSDARLDMRMDGQGSGQSAYEIVNTYSEMRLANIFFQYGEERQSRRIARFILEARTHGPIETTTELADLVYRSIPKRFHPKGIHPATRVFQALRIEVNQELRDLGDTLERAVHCLVPGGRMCIISFHSLEDRIVKQSFSKMAKGCDCPPDFPECVCRKSPVLRILSRKPIRPSDKECKENPRSRSAKLRIAEKLPAERL